jgi:predicted acyltransferase (DUF342 family)
MSKKYELVRGKFGLYRIKALKSFEDVKAGDLGGLIEREHNLSHEGTCWVYAGARVFGDAKVSENAQVWGGATVYGNAWVCGDAQVFSDAKVCGSAVVYGYATVYGNAQVFSDARVFGNAKVSENAQVWGGATVYGNAWVCGDAQVFGHIQVQGNVEITGYVGVYDLKTLLPYLSPAHKVLYG